MRAEVLCSAAHVTTAFDQQTGTATAQTHKHVPTFPQEMRGVRADGEVSHVTMFFNVTVCVMCAEPRTQDSRGCPDEEDEDGEEQGSIHSGREEQEEGTEEEEVLQWRGPGP